MAPPDKVKPTPPSVNPAQDQATVETQKEVNTLVFNEQVFLLDYLNVMPQVFNNTLAQIQQVINLTSGKDSPVINDFLIKSDSVFQFIQSITTEEYAQLVPKIQLFLVKGDAQVPIPLATPTNLQKKGTDGYFSGNTMGLKSLNMSVDGATNPITGKIFNIEMTLLFDSINTFFGPIPGASVTYADIFRSYQGHNTAIKASIGYDTRNKELQKKYSLDTLTFSAYLQFITSDIKIEENLKTTIKARFQGYQESIIADRQLFNFIEIDLTSQKKERDDKIKEIEASHGEKIASRKEALKALENVRKVAEGIEQEPLSETYSQKGLQNNVYMQALGRSLGGDGKAKERAALAEFGIKVAVMGGASYISTESDNAEIRLLHKKGMFAKKDYKTAFLKALDDHKKIATASIQSLEEEKRLLTKVAAADVNSLRIGAINQILNSAIFSKEAFAEINLTPDQLKSYIDGATALKGQKNYFNQLDPVVAKPTNVGTLGENFKREQKKVTFSAEIEADLKARRRKQMEKESRSGDSKEAKEKFEILSGQRRGADAGPTAKERMDKISSYEQLKSLIYEQKTIQYILLGDLVSVVMDYLLKNKEGAENKKVLKKMRFFMTQINVINPFNGGGSQTVNMYNLPISSMMLQKFFADSLYGTFSESMNMFELFRGLIDMLALAQKKRSRFRGITTGVNNNYSIQFVPYPVEEFSVDLILGKSDAMHVISTKSSNSKGVLNGIIFFARESNISLKGLGGNYIKNVRAGVPHFFFGGNAVGIVKSISASEKDAKGFKKAVWEKNQSNNASTDRENSSTIPAIFDVTIETMGMPYFQMGAYFYLSTPTINNYKGNWFLLPGYYQIVELSHEYTANGMFVSKIKGIQQIADAKPAPSAKEVLSAAQAGDIPSVAAAPLSEEVREATINGMKAIASNAVKGITGKLKVGE